MGLTSAEGRTTPFGAASAVSGRTTVPASAEPPPDGSGPDARTQTSHDVLPEDVAAHPIRPYEGFDRIALCVALPSHFTIAAWTGFGYPVLV